MPPAKSPPKGSKAKASSPANAKGGKGGAKAKPKKKSKAKEGEASFKPEVDEEGPIRAPSPGSVMDFPTEPPLAMTTGDDFLDRLQRAEKRDAREQVKLEAIRGGAVAVS
jgi:hypothetical protein